MNGLLEIVGRLLLAGVLGGVIGFERESLNRPAGFRTHILVSVGSALVMMVSLDVGRMFGGQMSADPGRIAAQVVSGIGFLGAGTIIREGATIRGLTTAASLWVIAGVGLATGMGMYLPAIFATAVLFVTLTTLTGLEKRLRGKKYLHMLRLLIDDVPGQIGRVGSVLGSRGVDIKNIEMQPETAETARLELFVRMPANMALAEVAAELRKTEGVRRVEYAE